MASTTEVQRLASSTHTQVFSSTKVYFWGARPTSGLSRNRVPQALAKKPAVGLAIAVLA